MKIDTQIKQDFSKFCHRIDFNIILLASVHQAHNKDGDIKGYNTGILTSKIDCFLFFIISGLRQARNAATRDEH